MARRLTQEEFIAKATELHEGKYSYEHTIYVRSADKVEVTCPIHGSFFVTANNHISKSNLCGCPDCYGNRKLTHEEFIAIASNVHNGKYFYSKVNYVNTQTHVTITCPIHGDFEQIPTRHMAGRGCHSCGGTKRQSVSTLIDKALEVHNGFYDYSLVRQGARATDNVTIVCPLHGPFLQKLKLHINRDYGCIKCAQKSKGEEALAAFLSLETAVERRNRTILSGKEIDIWLPEHNIGVEYHGLYWHTFDKVGHLHREKWDLAEKAGVRVIQVFSDEWEYKQNIVKARLLAAIGKSEAYSARQLVLQRVDMKAIRSFLENTHLQGAGVSAVNYALYNGKSIVAVATFAPSRTGGMARANNKGEWEVVRYASIGRVRGGFSKMFTRFISDVNPTKVISYCDLRYGNGKLYAATGFTLDSITEPDYWWVPKNKKSRVPRYNTQKHKIAQKGHTLHPYYAPGKTEAQICNEAGWEKIYGIGNQKWVWVS